MSWILPTIVDIACLLIVGIPMYFHNPLMKSLVFKRGFFCNDETIAYPHKPSTISDFVLHFTAIAINLITITIFELFRARRSNLTRSSFAFGLYRIILFFAFGYFITESTSTVIKVMIGRLRPFFLQICQPNTTLLQQLCRDSRGFDIYVEGDVCTGDPLNVIYARDSFPSGHAAIAVYSMIYLVFYLELRWTFDEFKLFKVFIQFGAVLLALATSLTRINDYKHDYNDILGGFILGFVVVSCVVFFVADLFGSKKENFELNNESDGEKKPLLDNRR